MRIYHALFAALLTLTLPANATPEEAPAPEPTALEKAHAWVLSFIVKNAPPGRKVYFPQGQETEEEALERYKDIAWDIVELAYSKETAPIFKSQNHGRTQMASVWLGIMLHESGFTKHVDYNLGNFGRGDGGLSWCMMQMRIGKGRTVPWNAVEDRQPWWGDNPDDIFPGFEGEDLILDRQKCIGEAHHLIRLSFKKCETLPLLERLTAYTIGKCKVTRPDDPEDVEYVRAGRAKSRARMSSAILYFSRTSAGRGFRDQEVTTELEALKSAISFVGPHEVKGFPMDRALIRRLRTAAARGYTVANASAYAKALGGNGTETSAAELLELALQAKADVVAPAPAPVVEEPPAEEPPAEEPPAEEEAPEAVAELDLSKMTKDELYEVAQERDIPGRSKMDKDELLAALQES
jgi:hypothetical protein